MIFPWEWEDGGWLVCFHHRNIDAWERQWYSNYAGTVTIYGIAGRGYDIGMIITKEGTNGYERENKFV